MKPYYFELVTLQNDCIGLNDILIINVESILRLDRSI